jgi:hypothetical protein
MVKLSVLEDLTVQPITRQTLHDMWTTATLQTITEDDLAPELLPLVSQGSEPSVAPGKIWHDPRDELYKVYTDVLDGTGVSLWLAFGPDRLETACLCAEPIAAGACVAVTYDRYVTPASNPGDSGDVRFIGVNQSGVFWPLNEGTSDTAASGTWIRVGLEGIMPVFRNDGGAVSSLYYSINHNEPLFIDPRFAGQVITSDASPTPDFIPEIGACLENTAGYTVADQIDGAHRFLAIIHSPRTCRGLA